jgi:hypothetical protein
LLEYAKKENSDALYHIKHVENGLACKCICPECGNPLVARNGGKTDKSYHFAHYKSVETIGCLMTQLHLVAQHYFRDLESFELPEVSFLYKGTDLFYPRTKIKVNSENARCEAKFGLYSADVLLESGAVNIVIEVCVTHKNEADKTEFYRQSQTPSIEFDLSSYLNREISEAVTDLKENKVPYAWLYEWCRKRLIDEHEQKIKQQVEELRSHRISSADNAAATIEEEKKIRLPELEHEFIYETGEYRFSDFKLVSKDGCCKFSNVKRIEENELFIHLKGLRNQNAISLLLLLSDSVPNLVDDLEETIVIRLAPSSLNELAIWRWHRHPLLDRKIEEQQRLYEADCQIQISRIPDTRNAEKRAYDLSVQFESKSDDYFKKDYRRWKSWLENIGIPYKKNTKGNPKIPPALKYIRSYPCLWVFNSWSIFVLSLLAEIVDEKPFGEIIPYKELFAELSGSLSLHPKFLEIERQVSPLMVDYDMKKLLLRDEILEGALRPFEIFGAVICLDKGVRRTSSLLMLFNC